MTANAFSFDSLFKHLTFRFVPLIIGVPLAVVVLPPWLAPMLPQGDLTLPMASACLILLGTCMVLYAFFRLGFHQMESKVPGAGFLFGSIWYLTAAWQLGFTVWTGGDAGGAFPMLSGFGFVAYLGLLYRTR